MCGKSTFLSGQTIILLCILLFGGAFGCHRDIPFLCAKELQAVLDKSLETVGVPGAAALVVNAAGHTWHGAAGFSSLDNSMPIPSGEAWTGTAMTTNLHTRAGSITKSFTAALILRLQEENLLSIENVIDDYFSGLVPYSDVITLRQLLNMTAGIINYSDVPSWEEAWPQGEYTPESLVQAAVDAGGTSFPPGEGWEYSNTNYVILGMIAEQVGGAGYGQLVRDYIIEPLGLSNTFVSEAGDATIPPPVLYGYSWAFSDTQDWEEVTWVEPSWAYSAGNVISTLDDLYHWMHALVEGAFLSEASHQMMWDTVETGHNFTYGMGVLHVVDSGLDTYGHNGGMPGYETSAYRQNGVYVIVMTNGNVHPNTGIETHAGDYIAKALARHIYDLN